MLVKDISFPTPQENILYEEVLLHLAERGRPDEILRFWESSEPFIVLGRIGNEEDDLRTENVLADRIPVLRRSSGGGTVVQGKGCLNYSLILSKTRDPRMADLKKSYQVILDEVIAAFKTLGIKAAFYPVSDIALADSQKKISGNAQKRGRTFILHHGTILYDFDLSKIERYLKFPKEVPDYRRGRAHTDFVANTYLQPKDIKEALCTRFVGKLQGKGLIPDEKTCLQSFLKTRSVYVGPPLGNMPQGSF